MTIYARILGILLSLVGVAGTVIVAIAFQESDSLEQKLPALGLAVVIYILLHFLAIYRFGFAKKAETISEKRSGIIF